MSLKSLVDGEKNEKKEEQTQETTEAISKEVKVRDDNSPINALDCSSCENGVSIPVKGISAKGSWGGAYGSLDLCCNVFCESSIWMVDADFGEGDLLEVQQDMTIMAQRYRQDRR